MKTYANLLGNDINRKMGFTSKLYALFREQRQEWKEGIGFLQDHVQYRRVGVAADSSAEFVAGDNAAYPEAIKANSTTNYGGSSTGGALNNTNNVDPPTDTLSFNKDTNVFGLAQKAFATGDFSIESLRAAAKSPQQLNQVVGLLTDYARECWVRHYRDEISRVAGNRFVALASGDFTESGSDVECYETVTATRWNTHGWKTDYSVAGTIDTPDKQNTAALDWAHLEDILLRVLEEGADDYATVMADGQPCPILVTDPKTARRLLADASNSNAVRTDIRESSQADKLLKGLGVQYAIKGWIIIPDRSPRHFDITGDSADSSGATGQGVWTERDFYSNTTNSRVISGLYRSALFGESYVILPKAFTCFTPRPSYTGVDPARFSAQDYTGEYEFAVIPNKLDNPWKAHGYFQGKIACATVAEDKDLLYVIRHRLGSGVAGA